MNKDSLPYNATHYNGAEKWPFTDYNAEKISCFCLPSICCRCLSNDILCLLFTFLGGILCLLFSFLCGTLSLLFTILGGILRLLFAFSLSLRDCTSASSTGF